MIKRKKFRTLRKPSKKPNKRPKEKSISKLIKEADRLFSLKVRQNGARPSGEQYCYTCNHPNHWKKLHCGHFLSRYYKAARWDYDNARPQCMMCNLWKKGDTVVFRENLVAEIGEERVKIVEAKRHQSTKLTREYIKEIIEQLSIATILPPVSKRWG